MSPDLSKLPRVTLDPRELGELAKLMFEWPIQRAPRLTLPLCILLAAVVQTGMVVVFSISYEAPTAKLPIAPRFYFLPPDSPAARQAEAWLDANDPALFAPGRATASAVPPPPPLKYRPSYEEPPPPLHPLPKTEEPTIVPAQLPLIPMTSSGNALHPNRPQLSATSSIPAPSSAKPVQPLEASSGQIEWLDDLAARLMMGNGSTPGPQFVAPKPSLYQVAIGPEGIIRHCVLTESSGDVAADEAGRSWIMTQRFQPAGATTWGRVLIPWDQKSQGSSTPSTPTATP
jgi:hypothetical protein